jgi:type I restriction enzyme S subunit
VKRMNFTDAEMVTYRLEPGDLLLNEASGSRHEVGKPALWLSEIDDCAFQNTLLRVRPNAAEPRFLFHYFRYMATTGGFADRSRGVGIYHLGRDALASLPVPKPSLDQQRRIADILDRAEALLAAHRRSAALFAALGHGIYDAMFGSLERDREASVSIARLQDLATISSGITLGRKTPAHTSPVPYMTVANVQDRRLDLRTVKTIEATDAEIERYQLVPGDLLLTEGGDPDKLGRGTLWRGELDLCIHQNHIFRVRVTRSDLLDPLYLNWHVGSTRGKSYFLRSAKQTTGIASINSTQLKSFPVVLPPLREQRLFAQRVESVDRWRALAGRQMYELDRLLKALQDRAFRGEL